MKFEDLNPTLQAKAKACETTEEILTLVHNEGYELSDDELTGLSGGSWCLDACSSHDDCGDYVPCEHIYPV